MLARGRVIRGLDSLPFQLGPALGCLSDKNLKTAPTIAWSMVHGIAGLAAQGATGNSGETLASKKVVLQSVLKSLEIK